jgi:hypothetical protein
MKQLSVVSQPGVDEPGAFVTVTAIPPSPCSAKAGGATAISEKIASNENDKHTDFFILEFFFYYAYILVFSGLLALGGFNIVQ